MTKQTAKKYMKLAQQLELTSWHDLVPGTENYMVIFEHNISHVSAVTAKEAKEFLRNYKKVGRFFST